MHRFADVAVVDQRGRVLMQERDEHAPTHPHRWGLPGGDLEAGERWIDAAVRELAEETGLQLPAAELTGLGRTTYFSEACGSTDEYELFVVHTDVSDADVRCGEGRQMELVDPAAVFERALHPAARMQLPDVVDSWPYRSRFDRPSSRRFAGVALVDRKGALLLQERDEHPVLDPEKWGFPGGHLEPDESFVDGAVRELAEETGVALDAGDLVLYDEIRVDHRDVHGSHDRMRVFAAATSLADADIECHEGRRMVFVDPATARRLPLTRSAAATLPGFLDSDLYARLGP